MDAGFQGGRVFDRAEHFRNDVREARSARGRDGWAGRGQGQRGEQIREIVAQLRDVIAELKRAVNGLVETRAPGGGAADRSSPSTDAGQPLRRLFASDYADGQNAMSGADRPSAREVSNAVSNADAPKENRADASDVFWAWGQFIDHDLDKTKGGGDPAPIAVPTGDPAFDPRAEGGQTLAFSRSAGVDNRLGARQQINEITALMDASMVYGSDDETTASLRSFEGGRLIMDENGEMPKDQRGFYLAGDDRANENAALTSMHTLFVREHNRLADEIAAKNPCLSDEAIFAKARAEVTAQIQAITMNEFLPILFGEDGMDRLMGDHQGYTGVDAQISNAFATAAFRFGHSMVSDSLKLIDENGVERDVKLADAFFNPQLVAESGIDDVLRGLERQEAQAMDAEIVDSLRNLVLDGPGRPRLDLAALNIQRGRDHGMPTLNDARRALGLEPLTGFDDPRLRDGVGEELASVYDSIEDVDLWVGLLSEKQAGDGLVGETQALILADQFRRTRDGDPNWYESVYSGADLERFNDLRLADIIERNTTVETQDRDVFRV